MLYQTHRDFEILIADDGSTPDTQKRIDALRPEFDEAGISIRHLWQHDEGFRKCRILNKAILAAENEYLVFTDGDCICRRDFLSVHAQRAETGYWLSGSYNKLPMETSLKIDREDVSTGVCFDRDWLISHGLSNTSPRLKLTQNTTLSQWLNKLTPTACNLKGSNASAWRADILKAGGFDERMQWGGLDRELGVRLNNAGIKARHVRYDAVCLHLDHSRGYKDPLHVAANKALRLTVAREGITHTVHGTEELDIDDMDQWLHQSKHVEPA